MKIYFATWIYEPSQQEALKNCGAMNRLQSFHHLNDSESKGKTTLGDYLKNEEKNERDSISD